MKNPLKFSGFQFDGAEREGFEPPVPLGTTVFKTVVIDHSTISPSIHCLFWRLRTAYRTSDL